MSHEWKHQPLTQSFLHKAFRRFYSLSYVCGEVYWYGASVLAQTVKNVPLQLLTEDWDILCASWWRATAPVLPLGLIGPPHHIATESGNVCHSKRSPRLCSSVVTGNCCDCSVADYHLSNILKFSPGGRYLVGGKSLKTPVFTRVPRLVWSYLLWWVGNRRESMPCLRCFLTLVLSYPLC